MTANFKYLKTGSIALFALTAALLQPLSYAQSPAKPGADSTQDSKASSSSMPGAMDMKAMMKDNNDKLSAMQMMGNTDVDFAMMMRMHHQGAIDMAEVELRDGKNPQMRKMAKDVVAALTKENAMIDKFLAKSGHPIDKMSK